MTRRDVVAYAITVLLVVGALWLLYLIGTSGYMQGLPDER
jgi:hypothetical protein